MLNLFKHLHPDNIILNQNLRLQLRIQNKSQFNPNSTLDA